MFTFLVTDDTPGLQINLQGEWIDVPPLKGGFIVNLGDLLQFWTNDTFKSTLHRVVGKLSAAGAVHGGPRAEDVSLGRVPQFPGE
jgi:isopenicillin N synthase-like dioxygenase